MPDIQGLAGVELLAIKDINDKIEKIQKRINKLPMCEERDILIKQREILKWYRDGKELMMKSN